MEWVIQVCYWGIGGIVYVMWIWLFDGVWQRMFWYDKKWIFFLSVFCFGVSVLLKVVVIVLLLLLFIVVSHDPWSSWFWPGHPLNSWLMRLLISSSNGIRLTMLLNRTKCGRRLNTDLGGSFHNKSWSVHVFIKVFEVCWSLVFIPPNGYDTLVQQTSIPLKEIIPLPPNQIPLSL